MPAWTVKEACPNVHVIEVDWDSRGGEFEALLMSDVHWDHPDCDTKLLRRHLDEALAKGAPVLDAGDWLDAMQGPQDRRRSIGSAKPEHAMPGYYTALTDTSAEFLAPYAPILTVRGAGNHETSVTRHCGVDLNRELVAKLRAMGAQHIHAGGYHGFVRFQFRRGNWRQSRVMYYHHGSGGGGYATRGALDVNKKASQVKADIVWGGHIHQWLMVPVQMLSLTNANRLVECEQLHIKTPGYKQSGAGAFGWEVEREMGVRPRGAAWLRFWEDGDELRFDARRAT
jgi:hypothetical protein